jgi:hypothetical protein
MNDREYDIYAEPADVDNDTLANLGPLRALAGVWRGEKGVDINPKEYGPETRGFIDHIDLQPIDPQTNGPQLFYGLRYHQHVITPDEAGTYHDQTGYWLWEPATDTIIQTLSIPRGQIAMAVGKATKDATRFELVAKRGETTFGICSNPFLEEAFKTLAYRIAVTVHPDGTWSYAEETTLLIKGADKPFAHRDTSTLVKISAPTPNPLARAQNAPR